MSGYRAGIAEETLDKVSLCLLRFFHLPYRLPNIANGCIAMLMLVSRNISAIGPKSIAPLTVSPTNRHSGAGTAPETEIRLVILFPESLIIRFFLIVLLYFTLSMLVVPLTIEVVFSPLRLLHLISRDGAFHLTNQDIGSSSPTATPRCSTAVSIGSHAWHGHH